MKSQIVAFLILATSSHAQELAISEISPAPPVPEIIAPPCSTIETVNGVTVTNDYALALWSDAVAELTQCRDAFDVCEGAYLAEKAAREQAQVKVRRCKKCFR